jgi:hypothetical protein
MQENRHLYNEPLPLLLSLPAHNKIFFSILDIILNHIWQGARAAVKENPNLTDRGDIKGGAERGILLWTTGKTKIKKES